MEIVGVMPQYLAFTVILNAVKNLRGSGSRRLLFVSPPLFNHRVRFHEIFRLRSI